MLVLQIVVASDCFGCEEALRLQREVLERFPELPVELIDIEAEADKKPAAVVAVPSYLIDGKIIFVGNPRFEELSARLSSAMFERGG